MHTGTISSKAQPEPNQVMEKHQSRIRSRMTQYETHGNEPISVLLLLIEADLLEYLSAKTLECNKVPVVLPSGQMRRLCYIYI